MFLMQYMPEFKEPDIFWFKKNGYEDCTEELNSENMYCDSDIPRSFYMNNYHYWAFKKRFYRATVAEVVSGWDYVDTTNLKPC